MTKYDIAGILTTYAHKIVNARNNRRVKEFIKELRKEIDLRKLEKQDEQTN